MTEAPGILIRHLGRRDYAPTWTAMRTFTDERGAQTPDELWVLEHPPVFTLGQAGRIEHLLDPGGIPVVGTDRGGQVTFHGPGQIVVYVLLDLRRRGLGIKGLVHLLEDAVIDLLASYNIEAQARPEAPGVYAAGAKVAALGLRVRRGCSYHGLALNVDMDLGPFLRIDPCGYRGLAVTQLVDLGGPKDLAAVGQALAEKILRRLALAARPGVGPGRERKSPWLLHSYHEPQTLTDLSVTSMGASPTVKVLFVCMGNICRSPTAHGVFRRLIRDEGLSERIEIDSAGTHGYHLGEPPDRRAVQTAARRGVDLNDLRARRVRPDDFRVFDYILAMDQDNYVSLSSVCPPGMEHKLSLLMAFAPDLGIREVPDPYYGGPGGFESVFDLVEAAARGLLDDIRKQRF